MKTKKIFLLLVFLASINTLKATIHYFNPINGPNSPSYCISSFPNDTIVIYKYPYLTSSTIWFINGVYQGVHDSLIYVPSDTGRINVTCDFTTFYMYLFSCTPSEVYFSIKSGGNLDTTTNIISKCDSSIIVFSHLKTIYPNNQNVSTLHYFSCPNGDTIWAMDSIELAVSGEYHFVQSNTCGLTIDTFYVVQLPKSLPNWTDTSFCNTSIMNNIDAGVGWSSYLWNNGAITQYINIDTSLSDTSMTYQVIASNICITDTAIFNIEQWNFPSPNISQFNSSIIFCADSVIILNPYPGFTYDNYFWSWNNGSSNNQTLAISGDTITGSGVYSIYTTMGFGCIASSLDSFAFVADPEPVNICVATVDTSGQIMVAWERDEVVSSYNIYRLIGCDYIVVGNSSYNNPTIWYDTLVDPNIRSHRYKVSAISNICGDEGYPGNFHGTIHISTTSNPNGGYDLTITDSYIDGSGQFFPNKYYILVDSFNIGKLSIIDSISTVFNSYYIQNPINGATYAIGVRLPYSCSNKSSAKIGKSSSAFSVSNKTSILTSISKPTKTNNKLYIYPNPSIDKFIIKSTYSINKVDIYNTLGELVLTKYNEHKIDLSGYKKGLYYAKIKTSSGYVFIKKIILK